MIRDSFFIVLRLLGFFACCAPLLTDTSRTSPAIALSFGVGSSSRLGILVDVPLSGRVLLGLPRCLLAAFCAVPVAVIAAAAAKKPPPTPSALNADQTERVTTLTASHGAPGAKATCRIQPAVAWMK